MIFLDAHMFKLTLIQPLKFDTCLGILLPQCPNTQTHTHAASQSSSMPRWYLISCLQRHTRTLYFATAVLLTCRSKLSLCILITKSWKRYRDRKERFSIIPKNWISGKCNKKTLISTWKQHFEAQLSTAQLGFSRTLNCGSRALFRTVQSGKNSE